MQLSPFGQLFALPLVEQDRCADEAGIVIGVQVQVFEVILEDVVRPVSNGRAFLAVERFSNPYSSDYLVIITKNFANLHFFLLKANPFGTEHLPFLREGIAIFFEDFLSMLLFGKIIILFGGEAICTNPSCYFILFLE